jgi:Protein of unknown function (DUF2934)
MAKRTTRTTASESSDSSAKYLSGPAGIADDATRNTSMASEPSEEEIRIRAYRRYLERGCLDGQDFDDWLEAERELKPRS